MKIALKTLAMKARVYNQIRTFLYKKRLESFTDKQKAEFFDKIFQANHETHWELVAYKKKRQKKAEIQRLREERGWKPKPKTRKEEYLKKNLAVSK